MASLTEMRIVNCLQVASLVSDGRATRELRDLDIHDSDDAGTVLDYILSTEALLQTLKSLIVSEDARYTDHRLVRVTWAPSHASPGSGVHVRGDQADAVAYRLKMSDFRPKIWQWDRHR